MQTQAIFFCSMQLVGNNVKTILLASRVKDNQPVKDAVDHTKKQN